MSLRPLVGSVRSWSTSSLRRAIHVLGVETSCDDTGVGIVNERGDILANCVNSQLEKHLSIGGVLPAIAREEHLSNIDAVAREAFTKSKLKSVATDIDAIAVTNRPGLEMSLVIGLNYARELAKKYSLPLMPIHHMQAHALMPLLQHRTIRFPFLALLISGGHALIAVAKRYNEFHLLGQSKDDAPGDLLDKVARRLRLRNLGAPFNAISGGASIELLASREGANPWKYFTSIPVIDTRDCDMSFSGYRGTFEKIIPVVDKLWITGNRQELLVELSHISCSLQRAILSQICRKLHRALMFYRMHWRYANEDAFCDTKAGAGQTDHLGFELQSIMDEERFVDVVISGGCAANRYLVEGIDKICGEGIDEGIRVFAPPKHLCSDNGLMIAWNGLLRYKSYLNAQSQAKSTVETRGVEDLVVLPNGDETDSQLNNIIASKDCPIGPDMRLLVQTLNFKLKNLAHPMIRLEPIEQPC